MVMAEVKLEHCRHGTEGCFVSPGDVREVRSDNGMSDQLVEALKRLEQHADAWMRFPPDVEHIKNIQAITSIAILECKRTIEALWLHEQSNRKSPV